MNYLKVIGINRTNFIIPIKPIIYGKYSHLLCIRDVKDL